MADNNTYIVQKGDNLTKIANANNTTVDTLAKLNNISNINLIYVGQELILSGEAKTTPSQTRTAYIKHFGLQANTERNVFITWEWWQHDKTDHYEVQWSYYNGDVDENGKEHWHPESIVTTKYKESIYTVDAIVKKVKATVKPISKEINNTSSAYLANDQTNKLYFEVDESSEKIYSFDVEVLKKPDAPEISIDGTSLTLELNNLTSDKVGTIDGIEFEIVKDDLDVVETARVIASTLSVTYVYNKCKKDSSYKARCRGFYETSTSDWSDYTDPVYSPATEPDIVSITVTSSTSARVLFKHTRGKEYKLEYTYRNPETSSAILENENYFNVIGADIKSSDVIVGTDNGGIEPIDNKIPVNIVGLQSGYIYYVRVCVASSFTTKSSSKWSEVKSFTVGLIPGPASIWSSQSAVKVGDELKLYWMHNPKDMSVQEKAEIYCEIGKYMYNSDGRREFVPDTYEDSTTGEKLTRSVTAIYTSPTEWDLGVFKKAYKRDPDDINDQTYVCEINTLSTLLKYGATIRWRVRTAGVIEDEYGNPAYGNWSDWNEVDIYDPPTVSVVCYDGSGNQTGLVTSLPLFIEIDASSSNIQKPTGYNISISNLSEYETVDNLGISKVVVANSIVYSKNYSTRIDYLYNDIFAQDINLVNNVRYRVTVNVTFDSGLSASATYEFTVAWDQELLVPLGTVYIDKQNISASISSYVETEDTDILLSVYRKEYDGSFTKIQENMKNNTTCVDKYPSLNHARYRIVSKSSTTGTISYNDIAPKYVGVNYAVLQWNDGSDNLLRLRYNLDINKKHNPDVSLINYIGREHPVSYYGTQLGETESWSTEIPKRDEDTLYEIRRLARWMGDVYIREPSGLGYYANVTVSYNRRHRALTIPITLNITRVEGGN